MAWYDMAMTRGLRSALSALALAGLLYVWGCASQNSDQATATATATQTPLQQLIAGNERYAAGQPIHPRQDVARREDVANGQNPIAVIVGCSDSRVPPEIVFDQGLGDLFVVRTAGNVVDDQATGSIEYAVEHLHVHLIIVLGHENCGAVAAAVSGGTMDGHIGSITDAIQPAVEQARPWPGNLLDNAINANVLRVVYQLKHSEPILEHEVETGNLTVLGARYNLAPGTLEWLTPVQ
jgi:carbonic anhydrase